MDSLAATVASSTCIQAIALTYYLNQNNLTDILVVLLFSIFGFCYSTSLLQNYTLVIQAVYLLVFYWLSKYFV